MTIRKRMKARRKGLKNKKENIGRTVQNLAMIGFFEKYGIIVVI